MINLEIKAYRLLLVAALTASNLHAEALDPARSNRDWLIDPAPYHAAVSTTADAIVLDNGLVRRVIRTENGCATIALDNLTTGQQMLRSVRPEALVTLDGAEYLVGGLDGQPVHNYLDPAWLKTMKPLPGAYEFDHAEVGLTKERFPWKKRLEWMPSDVPWPPPGKSVTLHFRPPSVPSAKLAGAILLEDSFQGTLKPAWEVQASKSHPRASFANEGKAGEIMAISDTCVFAEQPLPKNAVTLEVVADTGDDTYANSWGPGLALMAGGQPMASFVMRPNSQQYEFCTPAVGEQRAGKFDRAKPATLRVRLEGDSAWFEASQDGRKFIALGHSKLSKQPDALRIGKVGKAGGGKDYEPVPADKNALPPRCHIRSITVRAAEPPAPAVARTDLPTIQVHYEIYDGLPLISKWITVHNGTDKPARLNKFTCEILAAVEPESIVDDSPSWRLPNLFVETDYTFGGMSGPNHSAGVNWVTDPLYPTQVNYNRRTPCLLECRPPIGPDQVIAPGGVFASFCAFELLHDSTDRERQTLAMRRMYRTLAPWVTENPVLMHVISANPQTIRQAIDQCAAVGFEMLILSFGSGFNYESRDPKYQQQIKELADYGRSKGVALGGYSLLASRGAGTGADNTQGSPPRYGVMPCLGAEWGLDYLAQLKRFMDVAGLGVLEHDGSYPGDMCAATNHPHHRGLDDSQWVMWQAITGLYEWCCANGIYLNIPDWYFLNGATKTAMGYREDNWSLPREYQEIIERQNIFDGTWEKTPSMGWMFVPLTQYHGGGAAATIEPLKEHLSHYEQRLANLFGAGVQACYRGPRLFDAPETETLVKKWVAFYKLHRAILDSDILHLRRADGRDLDYILHVNPALKEKGLLMIYNPLDQPVSKTLTVPLYYTGLRDTAMVRERDGAVKTFKLDREFNVRLPVEVPAKGYTWMVIE